MRASPLLIAALMGLLVLPAHAKGLGRPCTDQPSNLWLSIKVMTEMLEKEGYKVKSGSFEKRCGDFYVVDPSGKDVELFLDPVSGKIVGRK